MYVYDLWCFKITNLIGTPLKTVASKGLLRFSCLHSEHQPQQSGILLYNKLAPFS